jgi:hypothetical protein
MFPARTDRSRLALLPPTVAGLTLVVTRADESIEIWSYNQYQIEGPAPCGVLIDEAGNQGPYDEREPETTKE